LDSNQEFSLHALKLAFLNSYFQTGLKNIIDDEIITYVQDVNNIDIKTEEYFKFNEIPFDFLRKRMSVLLQEKNKKSFLICKGAVEEMLQICSHILINKTQLLDDNRREQIKN